MLYRKSKYTETLRVKNKQYVVSLLTNAIVQIDFDIDDADSINSLSEGDFDCLLKNGIITNLSKVDELVFAKDFLKKIWENNKTKTLVTVVPSLLCNLACPYCYERDLGVDSQHSVMSDSEMKMVIDYLAKHQIKDIALYGGEPLLKRNKSILEPLFHFIIEQKGSINVTSNGTQVDEYMDFFRPDCISCIQITIDGMQDINDRYRVTKGGRGTYDTIINNIDMLICKGVNISIRMNINSENHESCQEFSRFIKEKYQNMKNIQVYFSPIRGDMCSYNYGEKGFIHPATMPIDNQMDRDSLAILPSGSFCGTTSRSGSLVFAPMGIWNCWHDVGVKQKKLCNYCELEDMENYHTKLPQFSNPCISCEYLLLCSGDCLVEYRENCDIESKRKMFRGSFENIISRRLKNESSASCSC